MCSLCNLDGVRKVIVQQVGGLNACLLAAMAAVQLAGCSVIGGMWYYLDVRKDVFKSWRNHESAQSHG